MRIQAFHVQGEFVMESLGDQSEMTGIGRQITNEAHPVYPWSFGKIYLLMRLAAPSLESSPPKPVANGSAGEMAGIIQEVQVWDTKEL